MTREFVMMPVFDKRWKSMGLTDSDLKSLQEEILKDPKKAPVIQGTGGLRKLRFALPNRGKSGSVRVAYVDFEAAEKTFFIFAYPKNEKENFNAEEINTIYKLIKKLEENI